MDTFRLKRLRELRDSALRYMRSNGADKPKGEIPVADLKSHLAMTEAEYRSLYLMLFNDGLIRTDGRGAHIGLTDAGKSEADSLDLRLRDFAEPSVAIPAADRIVPLNHNNPDYIAVTHDLERLEDSVRGANDYRDDDDKDQRVAEVGAMRRILAAGRARADVMITLVFRGLQYFTKTFADKAIGAIALGLIALIGRLTGLW